MSTDTPNDTATTPAGSPRSAARVNVVSRLRTLVKTLRARWARRFRKSDGSVTESALHDVYWLLRYCRGQALEAMLERYRALLARRRWPAADIDRRLTEMEAFLTDAVGVRAGGPPTPAPLLLTEGASPDAGGDDFPANCPRSDQWGPHVIYELRWRDGRWRRLDADDAVTDAEGLALLQGAGQLVAIADDGSESVVLDGGITLSIPAKAPPAADHPATPVQAIFVLSGDKVAWWPGRRFDSIEDFDTILKLHRAARSQRLETLRVTLLLEWEDGTRRILTLVPLVETLGERLRRALLSALLEPPGPGPTQGSGRPS